MKNSTAPVFWRACIIFLAAWPLLGSSQPRLEVPEFVGIVREGEKAYVALVQRTTGQSLWRVVGQEAWSLKLTEISEDKSTVTLLDTNGVSHNLSLKKAALKQSASESFPASYTKEWINSKENPMLLHAMSLPLEIEMGWRDLTEGEKASIYKWYLDHGWKVDIISSEGAFELKYTSIYAEERKAIQKQKLEKFRSSLSAAQRELFEMRRLPVPMGSSRSVSNENDVKFRESLSPAQQEALKSVSDFTKP